MLKEEIRKQCMENPDLFGDIARATEKTPGATLQMLSRNSSIELRSVDVINVIKKYTGLSEDEILEPKTEVA